MRTAHLIHGFNVSDGGKSTVAKLEPFFASAGLRVVVHDYGWVGPLRLRFRNKKTVERLLEHIAPGDILVGHSNGALICWQLIEAGAPASEVVVIQPALRRDTKWARHVWVLCLWNKGDLAVQFGRVWGRLTSLLTFRFHGWGAAGRYGFDTKSPRVSQWQTDADQWEPFQASGHSTVFRPRLIWFWGRRVAQWCKRD